ncbi:hypothetical protein ACE3MQ_19780 [Paenibacillus lentus]|uniref:hypothetical protein n=1 Tax=Paenibacillus lentus TaxID=1338368 RepID=UPI00364C89E3
MFKFKAKNNSVQTSIPQSYTLHGVVIKKLPNGQYFKAIQTMENLPEIILKQCFPNMKPDQVIEQLKSVDESMIYGMISKLLRVVPEQFLRLIAELIDTEYEYLRDELSPKETFDVLKAFWEVNDYTDFFAEIKKMMGGAKENPLRILKLGSRKS